MAEQLSGDIAMARAAKHEAQDELQAEKLRVEQISADLAEARAAAKKAEAAASKLRVQLKDEKEQAEQLSGDLSLAGSAADEAEKALALARAELQDERAQSEKHLHRTAALVQQLEACANEDKAADIQERSNEDKGAHEQNRELVLTVHQFKLECELLDAETCDLKDRLAVFETDLERVQGENAVLSGHINHKQKIRHTLRMKEEIDELRTKLSFAYKRIAKLEVGNFGCNFFEALASLGMCLGEGGQPEPLNASPKDTGRSLEQQLYTSPTPQRRRASANGRYTATGSVVVELTNNKKVQELEKKCALQQRALERVSIDYCHFVALIERTVFLADASEYAEALAVPTVARPLPELMHRLRAVIVEAQQQRSGRIAEHGAGAAGDYDDDGSYGLPGGGSCITTASTFVGSVPDAV